MRELSGLRYSYKDADPVMEDLDPIEWGATRSVARMPGAAPQVCRSVNNANPRARRYFREARLSVATVRSTWSIDGRVYVRFRG